MRHKWDQKQIKGSRHIDGIIQKCVHCGCLKEFVNGIPSYFLKDTAYTYSPECQKPLTDAQKHMIMLAVEECSERDKSPEYLFQYATDISGADYDLVVDYIYYAIRKRLRIIP